MRVYLRDEKMTSRLCLFASIAVCSYDFVTLTITNTYIFNIFPSPSLMSRSRSLLFRSVLLFRHIAFFSLCIYIVCTICMNHQTKPASTIDDDDGRTDGQTDTQCLYTLTQVVPYIRPTERTNYKM